MIRILKQLDWIGTGGLASSDLLQNVLRLPLLVSPSPLRWRKWTGERKRLICGRPYCLPSVLGSQDSVHESEETRGESHCRLMRYIHSIKMFLFFLKWKWESCLWSGPLTGTMPHPLAQSSYPWTQGRFIYNPPQFSCYCIPYPCKDVSMRFDCLFATWRNESDDLAACRAGCTLQWTPRPSWLFCYEWFIWHVWRSCRRKTIGEGRTYSSHPPPSLKHKTWYQHMK